MTFIKQILNLWRICRQPHNIRHLSVNPKSRAADKEWHIGRKITGMETER